MGAKLTEGEVVDHVAYIFIPKRALGILTSLITSVVGYCALCITGVITLYTLVLYLCAFYLSTKLDR